MHKNRIQSRFDVLAAAELLDITVSVRRELVGILADDLLQGNDPAGATVLVEYVTAGISALADLQSNGWTYVQP